MKILSIVSFVLLFLYPEPCDTGYLADLNSKINNLSSTEIKTFFENFNDECPNNVEYAEFRNEMLFKITEKYPQITVKELNQIKAEPKKIVIREFSKSLLDFDFKKIIKSIKNSTGNEKLKSEIIIAISQNK